MSASAATSGRAATARRGRSRTSACRISYFAFVIDAFPRTVVGRRLASHMRTDLVLDTPRMGESGTSADMSASRGRDCLAHRDEMLQGYVVALEGEGNALLGQPGGLRMGAPAADQPSNRIGEPPHILRLWSAIAPRPGCTGPASP